MSVWEGTSQEGEFRVQQLTPVQLEIQIKLRAQHVDKCIATECRKLASRVRLPGFRAGKVPVALLRQRYGKGLELDVVEKQLHSVYVQALQKANVTPVQEASPQQPLAYESGKDLSCTFRVQVKPRVQLAQWQGLQVRVPEFIVGEQQIDHALQQLRQRYSVLAPIAPRETVVDGDVVSCCMRAHHQGKPVADLQYDNEEVSVGKNTVFPEIDRALVDKKVGESFGVQVQIPDNFANTTLRGELVMFDIKVLDVKQRQLPTIDDEFAKDVLPQGDTVAQLQEQIKQDLQEHKRMLQHKYCKEAVMDALLKLHDIELPDALVKTCSDNLLRQMAEDMDISPDVWRQKADALMQKKLQERAHNSVKRDLILEAIAQHEHMEVSEQEIKQKVIEWTYGLSNKEAKDFMKRVDFNAVREAIRHEKALHLVVEKAKLDWFEKPLPMGLEPEPVEADI